LGKVVGTARNDWPAAPQAGAQSGFPTGRRTSRAPRRCIIHLEHVDILSEIAIKSCE